MLYYPCFSSRRGESLGARETESRARPRASSTLVYVMSVVMASDLGGREGGVTSRCLLALRLAPECGFEVLLVDVVRVV